MPPTSVMTSDKTVAKIGRSMKKRETICHQFGNGNSCLFRLFFCSLPPLATIAVCLVPLSCLSAASGSVFVVGRGRDARHLALLGPYVHPRPDLLQRADQHEVALLQPLDDAQAIRLQRPGGDAAVLSLVLRIDDIDVLQPLVGLDGPINDEQSHVRLANRQADADKHAGREQPTGANSAWRQSR